jgi:uncharacterized repeat protein (TIGR01451 family)
MTLFLTSCKQKGFLPLGIVILLLLFSQGLWSQAILTTGGDKNQIIYFPAPNAGLPTPEQYVIPEVPTSARPHGLTYAGAETALIGDFNNSRIFLLRMITRAIYATLDTSAVGYKGTGTLAASPDGKYVLACGAASTSETASTLYVIPAPFDNPLNIIKVPLTGAVKPEQTQAIVFNPMGQAFVAHTGGISVLNPPYASVSFVMALPNSPKGGGISLTPDGYTLLATNFGSDVYVYSSPFSSRSIPATFSTPTIVNPGLSGIMVTPDGSRAIVACAYAPKVYTFSAPFNDSVLLQEIPLPPTVTLHPDWGFEDVGISADGSVAILTGNSPSKEFSFPAVFIQGPFNAQQAVVHAVNIPNGGVGGRGSGAVRFLPPGIAPGLTLGGTLAINRSTLTYTLQYSNLGSEIITQATLRFPLPEGTVFVSSTGGGKVSNGVVVWNLGDLSPSSRNSVTLTLRLTGTSPLQPVVYTIQGTGSPQVAGTSINTRLYFFPQLAFNDKWASTFTYVNPSSQPIQCTTRFYGTNGAPLSLEFTDTKGAAISSRTDDLPPNGIFRATTAAALSVPLQTGWAQCECSDNIKASLLYRFYGYDHQDPPQLVPTAEVGFNGQLNGATRFVTFAEKWTGFAVANPFAERSQVTISLRDSTGMPFQSTSLGLEPGNQTTFNLKTIFGFEDFYGSATITATKPILNLAINGEAVTVFSALPAGEE